MDRQAIRVWLQPGYDGGRFGAWMLDLPGCFVWGRDRDVALARVPSGVGAFAAWLAEHGEAIAVPQTHELTIVEELATEPAEGFERWPTYAEDRRPVGGDELETHLRRLDLARTDLLALTDRLRSHGAAHGPLAAGDDSQAGGAARDVRTPEEALRHLAGSEIWLTGRLDPAARYAGPAIDGDLDAFLAGSRSWAIEQLRRIQAAGPLVETTDRRGETWTLPKVLRRLVYHSLDHLGELDRRLARAEGAADRLTLRGDVLIEPAQLDALFRSVGWYRLVREPGRLARLIEGSSQIVSAWDGDRLVGFARSISDDAAYGLISTVAVYPSWQGKGVARRLTGALLENNDGIRFSVSAVPGVEDLYASLGFEPDRRAMVRRRRY